LPLRPVGSAIRSEHTRHASIWPSSDRVMAMLAEGVTVRMIMAETGVGASAVYRIKAEIAEDY
jgi:Helix-turn-helix domain of resolvase